MGDLDGAYTLQPQPSISGMWALGDVASGATCVGPFRVTLVTE